MAIADVADQHEALLEAAEKKIQKILLDLVNEHGLNVVHVEVDTRRYANLAVQITASATIEN